ncbi:hypothetical protein [Chitinophaga nivalis]|uniref:VCBS repeat-containing protein n=1 Tax=Chitinophaga nivalis TaxID=2991709 RepID=A0ABT3IIE9_9BACT|nr:hypothetical protein [Chitinophaga nivalis]MCW3466567.1 hypothetical protein [Chitinophaga nivalis]MCW3483742.1 hypothetical protein [Chitinophaga nivalis]
MKCTNHIFFICGLAVVIGAACNNPLKSDTPQQEDSTITAAPVRDKPEIAFRQDTVTGNYRITALTKNDGNIHNLIIAVGNRKDTTRADSIVERDVKGDMKNMMVADLDANGAPELYCYMVSAGTGRYGKIYAFELNGKQATRISSIALDTLQDKEYKGADTFYIKGRSLVRSFPVVGEGSPEALATHDRREVVYTLFSPKGHEKILQRKP